MCNFSARLRQLRVAKKVYQKDMASFLGISLRAYQLYESGDGFPSVPGLVVIADYFDVSLDYLVGRSDEPRRV